MINTIFMNAAEALTNTAAESKAKAFIGVALAGALAAAAVAYCISKVVSKSVESMARQPEASDKIRAIASVNCLLIEGIGILSIFICLLISLLKL